MANKLIKLVTIFSILLALQVHVASSWDMEEEDDEEYILDTPFANTRLRSRFLASIKKGTSCGGNKKNVCDGVSANKGTGLLYCCKKHCRNVLGDRNNCGRCGSKCKLGEKCCNGGCINVLYDNRNCGKCGKTCYNGGSCDHGTCDYA